MRWIFVTLVFVNLLLLVFFWQKKQVLSLPPTAMSMELNSRAKPLVLVKELESALPPLKNREKTDITRSQLCYSVGPYADEIDAKYLLARANALGFSGKMMTIAVESGKPLEYWVYVPPRVSREAALQTLRALQGRNVDSYILTQGELAEGLSLGLFRNSESAYAIQRKVKALQIPAEVKVVDKRINEYWISISESAQLSEPMRQRIQGESTELRWELTECK